MMASSPASSCTLQREFAGAFTADMGDARLLIGAEAVKDLLGDKATMGGKIPVSDLGKDNSQVIMIVSSFATNTAQRPKITVSIARNHAMVIGTDNPNAIGGAVLNHPFWIGVFDQTCSLDVRLPPAD